MAAHEIDPVPFRHGADEPLGLDRRVGDDLQKLFVRPDVALIGGDVEIAAQKRRNVRLAACPHAPHLLDEGELVGEFRIDLRVRLVAAGRYIEIVDADLGSVDIDPHGEMTRIADLAEILPDDVLEGPLRKGRDAVIALLPMNGDVLIAQRPEGLFRKLVVGALGLLQAQDVGRLAL